jgi:hypothetical protein
VASRRTSSSGGCPTARRGRAAELVHEQHLDLDADIGWWQHARRVWVRNAGSTADAYDNPAANGSIAFGSRVVARRRPSSQSRA